MAKGKAMIKSQLHDPRVDTGINTDPVGVGMTTVSSSKQFDEVVDRIATNHSNLVEGNVRLACVLDRLRGCQPCEDVSQEKYAANGYVEQMMYGNGMIETQLMQLHSFLDELERYL